MAKLWTPVWYVDPDFSFPRSYLWAVGIAWYSGFVVQSTNPIILESSGLPGHVRLHLTFKDEFWAWSSNTYTPDWSIAEIYTTADWWPGPFSEGEWIVNWGVASGLHKTVFSLTRVGYAQQGYQFTLEGAPAGYWMPSFPS